MRRALTFGLVLVLGILGYAEMVHADERELPFGSPYEERLITNFHSYIYYTFDAYLRSEVTNLARWYDVDIEKTEHEFWNNIMYGLYGLDEDVIYRYGDNSLWVGEPIPLGAFGAYNKRILEEIELALLFTHPELNVHMIGWFVERKSIQCFGIENKWSGIMYLEVLDSLELTGNCSTATDNMTSEDLMECWRYNQDVISLTRDDLMLAICKAENSITVYLEMHEEDPR